VPAGTAVSVRDGDDGIGAIQKFLGRGLKSSVAGLSTLMYKSGRMNLRMLLDSKIAFSAAPESVPDCRHGFGQAGLARCEPRMSALASSEKTRAVGYQTYFFF